MSVTPTRTRTARAAATARRWWVDTVVALLVGLVQTLGTALAASHHDAPIPAGAYALLAAGSAALLTRRRFPIVALTLTLAAALWYDIAGYEVGTNWPALIIAFGTAIYLRRRAAAIGTLVIGYVGALWGPMLLTGHHAPTPVFALALAVGLLVLLAASEGVRLRRQRSDAQAARRREEALRHASEERLRIARDLHDVLAHSISVINVQANTALHLMDRQPPRAREALSTINEVSRQALTELRSVVGVLRQVDEGAPRAPSPTLARLDDLVTSARAAGLAVRVERVDVPEHLPANVELAAYRIVQEALTNVARHSNGSSARVRLASGEGELLVQIDDDGTGARGAALVPGHGIIGMTERARALGGELETSTLPGGGFRVRASLPCGVVSA
jgi:signal transduction histidine kinase